MERTESIRRRVATLISAGTREDVWTGKKETSAGNYNDLMLALRYAYVLALVVWLGGMVVLGAIVAPTILQVLQAGAPDTGRALAGAAFGAVLSRFHYVAYASGGVLLVTLALMAGARTAAARLCRPHPAHLPDAGAGGYSGMVVLGTLDTIHREVGALPSLLPAADVRRIRFDAAHVLSTRLMMLNIAAAMVLLYWEAREYER